MNSQDCFCRLEVLQFTPTTRDTDSLVGVLSKFNSTSIKNTAEILLVCPQHSCVAPEGVVQTWVHSSRLNMMRSPTILLFLWRNQKSKSGSVPPSKYPREKFWTFRGPFSIPPSVAPPRDPIQTPNFSSFKIDSSRFLVFQWYTLIPRRNFPKVYSNARPQSQQFRLEKMIPPNKKNQRKKVLTN